MGFCFQREMERCLIRYENNEPLDVRFVYLKIIDQGQIYSCKKFIEKHTHLIQSI